MLVLDLLFSVSKFGEWTNVPKMGTLVPSEYKYVHIIKFL